MDLGEFYIAFNNYVRKTYYPDIPCNEADSPECLINFLQENPIINYESTLTVPFALYRNMTDDSIASYVNGVTGAEFADDLNVLYYGTEVGIKQVINASCGYVRVPVNMEIQPLGPLHEYNLQVIQHLDFSIPGYESKTKQFFNNYCDHVNNALKGEGIIREMVGSNVQDYQLRHDPFTNVSWPLVNEFIQSNLDLQMAICADNRHLHISQRLREFLLPLSSLSTLECDAAVTEWCQSEDHLSQPECACFRTTSEHAVYNSIADELRLNEFPVEPICVFPECQDGVAYKTQVMKEQFCPSLCAGFAQINAHEYAVVDDKSVILMDCGGQGKGIMVTCQDSVCQEKMPNSICDMTREQQCVCKEGFVEVDGACVLPSTHQQLQQVEKEKKIHSSSSSLVDKNKHWMILFSVFFGAAFIFLIIFITFSVQKKRSELE